MNCKCPGPCVEHPVKMTILGPAVNAEKPDFFKDMTGALSNECERLRAEVELRRVQNEQMEKDLHSTRLQVRDLQKKLAAATCFCGPKTNLDPAAHDELTCQYARLMKQTEKPKSESDHKLSCESRNGAECDCRVKRVDAPQNGFPDWLCGAFRFGGDLRCHLDKGHLHDHRYWDDKIDAQWQR